MANQSIKNAFERFWQHVVAKLGDKADIDHTHDVVASATHATTADSATKATKADSATTASSATKATQDGNGKVIADTYETKSDASNKLAEAKSYTDEGIESLNEGFSSVIYQMYGDDLTEEGAPTIRGIANDEANTALDTAKGYTDSKITEKVGDKTVPVQVSEALTAAKAYTDDEIADLIGGAPTTLDTLNEIAIAMGENADVVEALETAVGNKANASDLTAHTSNKSNPHGVTLSQLGVTATAAELNVMDGVTATTAELNYVDGVTSNIQTQLNAKVPTSRTVNGKALSGNITLSASDVGADASGAASSALSSANSYTDAEIAEWVGDKTVASQISTAVSTKANTSDLTSHTGNTTAHITSTERTNWNAAKTHADSTHAPSNAQPNQNAFSNVKVGSTTVAADTTTDTLELAGSNVTITPDTTNDKVTIGITKDNVTAALGYTPPTTDTTYNAAGSSLGLVKSGGDVTISSGVITVNDDSHAHVISNVDGLQTALDAKAAASDLDALKELVGDTAVSTQISTAVAGKSDTGHTHDDRYYTESEINTKLAGKSDTSHTHSAYANQNAFSNVKVGDSTIAADSTTDTLTLTAGSNITLTADTSGDGVTIAAKDTVYTHPSSGVTAGTYKSVTVNAQGHVTGGSNPTTLAGYGITDAAAKTHTHDYAASSHTHDYAASSHTHDGRYYTESEVDTKFSNMVGDTAVPTQVSTALASAKSYTDEQIDAIVGEGASTTLDTIGEISAAIEDNQDMLDTLNSAIGNKADAGHTHNYAGSSSAGGAATSANKVNSSLTVKLNSGTTEGTNMFTFDGSNAKSVNITPSAIGAAASSHGTHVSYSTTAPVMDGTASAGSASTVARSDHKHPTDTSRAAASEVTALKGLVGDTAVATQISNAIDEITPESIGASASGHTHSYAAASHNHNDTYYTESEIDTKLSGKSDTGHTHNYAAASHGNHVPATETANNAKFLRNDNTWATVTPANIGAAASSHGTHVTWSTTTPKANGTAAVGSETKVARGDHVHPTDTTRAAASTVTALQGLVGDTAVSTQISNAVGAITPATLGITATATELNYCDGVTSNIQTQLDDKMDLTSDQTVTGVKTFTNGIEIGDEGVQLTYDTSEGAFKISFLSESIESDETETTTE